MKLVDSSSWIHAFRKTGDAAVRERVEHLLRNDDAAWCDLIRVELWRGVSAKAEESFLKELEPNLTLLPITQEAWDCACTLGLKSRKKGKPVPTTDIVIVACAIVHKVEIEHCDKHIDALLELNPLI